MRRVTLAKVERAVICLVLAAAVVIGALSCVNSGGGHVVVEPGTLAALAAISLDDAEALAKVGLVAVPLEVSLTSTTGLKKFSSYEELKEFVGVGTPVWSPGYPPYYYYYDGIDTPRVFSRSVNTTTGGAMKDFVELQDYSGTNIQVAGVDEADVVKTDGKYIYVILKDRIVIVDAAPAESAKVLCEIKLGGALHSMYINGDRLVIFETVFSDKTWEATTTPDDTLEVKMSIPMHPYKTHIKVYDVSNRENPVLANEVAVDGSYWASRMIGDCVYVVVKEPTYTWEDSILLPKIHVGDTVLETPATDVLHSDSSQSYKEFTTIVAIDVTKGTKEAQNLGYGMFLIESEAKTYASQNNLYIACSKYTYDSNGYYGNTSTQIHRIHIEGGKMLYDASGEVPGTVLNQFSMDEHESYFRIVTTAYWNKQNLYILGGNLSIVGRLENFAPQWEQFKSARFMGNRCYLVTFRQTDPLFVVDLSDPTSPKILGELVVPGYSDYLHPYDETHIIGIGRETGVWGLALKISLFDVSDVNNPKEIAKYVIQGSWTDSPVLTDHKALLFDRSRNLLAIPVMVQEGWDKPVWQGAYVFNISVEKGIELKGKITHHGTDAKIGEGYYYDSPLDVKRSLYIGNVLYTISDAKIKMNKLDTLEQINEVGLPEVETAEPVVTWQSPQVWASSSTALAFNG